MTEPQNGGGVRTPAWFVTAIGVAAILMATGWAASELRNADIESLRREMAGIREVLEQANIIRDRLTEAEHDSLKALSWETRSNNFRLCMIERRLRMDIGRLCVQFFPGK